MLIGSLWAALSIQSLLPLVGMFVLLGVWRLSIKWKLPSAVPVMLSFQWIQICSGIYYHAITGRLATEIESFDAELIVYVGLAYLVVLFLGVCIPLRRLNSRSSRRVGIDERSVLSATRARNLYLLWLPLAVALSGLAWTITPLTQQVLATLELRHVFLYALLYCAAGERRWMLFAIVVVVEILIGFSGFFSGYRASLTFAMIVTIDRLSRDGRPGQGRVVGTLLVLLVALSVVWTMIKTEVREQWRMEESRIERLDRVGSVLAATQFNLSTITDATDRLVHRAWDVYYPACVLERVPRIVPHENGRLLLRAVRHVLTPRALDPDKPRLINDSELVRTYAGVRVAGEESGTTVGFSYVSESYVDFGYEGMLLPVFAYGLLVGAFLVALATQLRNAIIRDAATAVVTFTALGQYAAPWTKVLGATLNIGIVIGVALLAWERLSTTSALRRMHNRSPTPRGARRDNELRRS